LTGTMVLGTLLYVILLLVNAIAILNEERFLARGECGVYHYLIRHKGLRSASYTLLSPNQSAGQRQLSINPPLTLLASLHQVKILASRQGW
jgi:hypothetical protein